MTDATGKSARAGSALGRWRSSVVGSVLARTASPLILVKRGPRTHGSKRVALTFDGGPGDMTARYFDECDRLGVRATFFLVGENVAKRPESVLEYVRRGHEVAGLGYTRTPFPRLAAAVLVDELTRTSDLFPPSRTSRPFVRPPDGDVTALSIARVAAAGYVTALWSLDSGDTTTHDPRLIEARVAADRMSDGEIVRFQEGQAWTLEALPRVVSQLQGAGFEACTLGELLGA